MARFYDLSNWLVSFKYMAAHPYEVSDGLSYLDTRSCLSTMCQRCWSLLDTIYNIFGSFQIGKSHLGTI